MLASGPLHAMHVYDHMSTLQRSSRSFARIQMKKKKLWNRSAWWCGRRLFYDTRLDSAAQTCVCVRTRRGAESIPHDIVYRVGKWISLCAPPHFQALLPLSHTRIHFASCLLLLFCWSSTFSPSFFFVLLFGCLMETEMGGKCIQRSIWKAIIPENDAESCRFHLWNAARYCHICPAYARPDILSYANRWCHSLIRCRRWLNAMSECICQSNVWLRIPVWSTFCWTISGMPPSFPGCPVERCHSQCWRYNRLADRPMRAGEQVNENNKYSLWANPITYVIFIYAWQQNVARRPLHRTEIGLVPTW